MALVTVTGSNTGTPAVSYSFSTGIGLTVAQQISLALASAVSIGKLSVTSAAGTGTIPVPVVGNNVVQELLLTGSVPGATNSPAGYGFVINNQTSASTITAAANTAILTGAFGGLFQGSGAATIVAAGGTNVISQTGAGAAVLSGGDGDDTVVALGSGTISGGLGKNLLQVNGNNELVLAIGDSDSVFFGPGATDGSDTIVASLGSNVFVFGSDGKLQFQNFGQARTFITGVAPTSALTVTSGGGTISGTAAGLVVKVTPGTTTNINSGTGGVTAFGSAGSTLNIAATNGGSASSPTFVVAGDGNETLNGANSTGPLWLSVNTTVAGGSSGAVRMIGGSGSDTLIVGGAPGTASMTGGAGADAFVFFKQTAGAGVNTITDFDTNVGGDSVFILRFFDGKSATDLQNAAAVVAGVGVTLTLSDGATVTFSNLIDKSQLNGKIQYE